MNEYVFTVELDNKTDSIKTFGKNLFDAVDDIISFDGVTQIFYVVNTNTNVQYMLDIFDRKGVETLREIRNKGNKLGIKQSIPDVSDEEIQEMFGIPVINHGKIIN
jgi:hypothetical protein